MRRQSFAAVVIASLAVAATGPTASWHGGAGSVAADVTRAPDADDVLVVHVSDDGTGPSAAPVPGLGTVMLDEVALHWRRTRLGERTELRVTLPTAAGWRPSAVTGT